MKDSREPDVDGNGGATVAEEKCRPHGRGMFTMRKFSQTPDKRRVVHHYRTQRITGDQERY